jgi:hypothetical protein
MIRQLFEDIGILIIFLLLSYYTRISDVPTFLINFNLYNIINLTNRNKNYFIRGAMLSAPNIKRIKVPGFETGVSDYEIRAVVSAESTIK